MANFLGAPPIFACVVSGNDRLTEARRQGCLRSQAVCPVFPKDRIEEVKQPEGRTPCLNYTLRQPSHNINLVDLPGALELFCR
jgi:hypothetical protein